MSFVFWGFYLGWERKIRLGAWGIERLGRTPVRWCLDSQEPRTNHCPASGGPGWHLTFWLGGGFGNFLEQAEPRTADSWSVRNDGQIIKGLSLGLIRVPFVCLAYGTSWELYWKLLCTCSNLPSSETGNIKTLGGPWQCPRSQRGCYPTGH